VGAAALFVSLGALALVASAGVALLLHAALPAAVPRPPLPRVPAGALALGALAGGLVAGLAAWYLIGVDTVGVLRTGLWQHSEIAGPSGYRSYHIWVWMNLVEFGIFLGLPATLAVVWAVPQVIGHLRAQGGLQLPACLTAGALVVLALLDLSGIVRGETSRIWLFFAPYLVPAAAATILPEERELRPCLTALALSALQLLIMSWTLQPLIRPY